MMATKKNGSINSLPNELLIVIFKLLYMMHRGLRFSREREESWIDDPFAPSAFPFAQANVCQRWRALLASYPTFWTRVVVASNATTLTDVIKYFSWSQGLPIDVVVKSNHGMLDMPLQVLDEKSYVNAILPHISHHLNHIRTIEFSVFHYPSIPDIRQWLVGPANFLTSIQVAHAGYLDYPFALPPCHPTSQIDRKWPETRFSVPELESLSVDWRTFARACRSNRTWLSGLPKLRHLSLTPSGTCSPLEHLSVDATIEALSHSCSLSIITLHGIPFVSDYTISPHRFHVSGMEFQDLRGTDVARLLHGLRADCRPDGMLIKNCSLEGLNDVVACVLHLEDLNEDCDLAELINDVESFELCFENCPAFDDDILDLMSEVGSDGEHFPAGDVFSLTLTRCTNFSVECLYRMARARRMAVEASPFWDGTEEGLVPFDPDVPTAIIKTLKVTGGPFLSEEYRTKFAQLVPEFEWINTEYVVGDVENGRS